jgi:hypothetical protein
MALAILGRMQDFPLLVRFGAIIACGALAGAGAAACTGSHAQGGLQGGAPADADLLPKQVTTARVSAVGGV